MKKKMSAAKKMKPGPKRKISDSARKRKKKRGKRKVKQKQDLHWRPISIWTELKSVLLLESNSEVAEVLLDR